MPKFYILGSLQCFCIGSQIALASLYYCCQFANGYTLLSIVSILCNSFDISFLLPPVSFVISQSISLPNFLAPLFRSSQAIRYLPSFRHSYGINFVEPNALQLLLILYLLTHLFFSHAFLVLFSFTSFNM